MSEKPYRLCICEVPASAAPSCPYYWVLSPPEEGPDICRSSRNYNTQDGAIAGGEAFAEILGVGIPVEIEVDRNPNGEAS